MEAGSISAEVRDDVGNKATKALLVDGDTVQPKLTPKAALAADKHDGAVATTDNWLATTDDTVRDAVPLTVKMGTNKLVTATVMDAVADEPNHDVTVTLNVYVLPDVSEFTGITADDAVVLTPEMTSGNDHA